MNSLLYYWLQNHLEYGNYKVSSFGTIPLEFFTELCIIHHWSSFKCYLQMLIFESKKFSNILTGNIQIKHFHTQIPQRQFQWFLVFK